MARRENTKKAQMIRGCVLAMILLFVWQQLSASIASARAFGECQGDLTDAPKSHHDHSSHQHASSDGHLQSHPGSWYAEPVPSTGHDHFAECCDWMCAPADLTITASLFVHGHPGGIADPVLSDRSASWPGVDIDRPPRIFRRTV